MSSRLGNVPQQPSGAARYAAPDARNAPQQQNDLTPQHHDIPMLAPTDEVGRLTLKLSAEARAKVKLLCHLLRHVRRPIPTKNGIRLDRPSETSIIERLILTFDLAKADELFSSGQTADEELA